MTAGLVEVVEVRTKLDQLSDIKFPASAKDEPRLQELIRHATGELLAAAGRSKPPAEGSVQRSALAGLCVEHVVNRTLYALFLTSPDMRRSLDEELARVLERAEAYADSEPGVGAFIDVVGAGS